MSRKRSVAIAGLLLAGLVPVFAATFSAESSSSEPVLAISDASVREDERAVTLTVTRTAVNNWTSTNFDVRSGTAQEGTDYVRASNHIMFNPGETTKTVTVPIVADNIAEGSETFTAFIYGTDNVPISRGDATVTITEVAPDEPPPPDEWTNCANEWGTCVVPGPSQVRYGAGNQFAFRDATDRIACDNQTFGDPAPYVGKSCAYRLIATASVELPSIASNFDVASELVPSWGTGAIPESAAPDVVGAFRFICNPGQILADDPIVYPGQPGRAHLHQFFGNTGANANSTYASLRTSGNSTCNSPLNRSAYWMPAMMNGKGKVVRPDYVSIYYKRRPASDPKCNPGSGDSQVMGKCVDLPRGLRFVFGRDMIDPNSPTTGWPYFNCDGAGAVSGHFPNIVEAAKGCPVGAQLGAVINAPECWDGKNLDTPDHRSHMAYPGYGWWGYLKCPDTHPYVIPTFTMGAWYTTDDDLDRSGTWDTSKSTWHLSSDVMPGMPMMTPGSSFHADWFGAWDDSVMKMWTDNCINKLLNCSGGDLGNGKQLKMFSGFTWRADPRVVDPPA